MCVCIILRWNPAPLAAHTHIQLQNTNNSMKIYWCLETRKLHRRSDVDNTTVKISHPGFEPGSHDWESGMMDQATLMGGLSWKGRFMGPFDEKWIAFSIDRKTLRQPLLGLYAVSLTEIWGRRKVVVCREACAIILRECENSRSNCIQRNRDAKAPIKISHPGFEPRSPDWESGMMGQATLMGWLCVEIRLILCNV